MGSSGTGHFSDYTNEPPTKGGGGGGSEGTDICRQSFESDVEEVGTSEYHHTVGKVPPKGTLVRVERRVRPAIVASDGMLIGYLPTKFNYLVSCMISGYEYSGEVTQSSNTRLPTVFVSIKAAEK